jgi:uncharacterized membrane protein YhaH (DUF805 family)
MSMDSDIAALKDKLNAVQTPANGFKMPSWWSTQEAMTISAVVLLFGAVVTIATLCLLFRREHISDRAVQLFIIPLVIFSVLFLVVAGYTDSQIAPAVGLLGTIVGYLLGKNDNGCRYQPPKEEHGKAADTTGK